MAIDEVLYSVLAVPKSSAAARWLWLFLANGSLSRFSELWALAPVPSPNFLLFLIRFLGNYKIEISSAKQTKFAGFSGSGGPD